MKLTEVYEIALKKKFALGAFNFYNLESMKGILNACQKLNVPVILAVSESALKYFGGEYLKQAIIAARKTYSIPFFVHLDHGKDLEICKTAIAVGFDSVMIDGSHLPLEENIKLTKSVVNYAHKKGVQVEGELGKLKGVEDDVCSDEQLFTDPEEAEYFVKQTGVDSLAIAIGTSHGINKFSGVPEIRTDILKKIEKKLKGVPLVLHGASSVNSETTNPCLSIRATLSLVYSRTYFCPFFSNSIFLFITIFSFLIQLFLSSWFCFSYWCSSRCYSVCYF